MVAWKNSGVAGWSGAVAVGLLPEASSRYAYGAGLHKADTLVSQSPDSHLFCREPAVVYALFQQTVVN